MKQSSQPNVGGAERDEISSTDRRGPNDPDAVDSRPVNCGVILDDPAVRGAPDRGVAAGHKWVTELVVARTRAADGNRVALAGQLESGDAWAPPCHLDLARKRRGGGDRGCEETREPTTGRQIPKQVAELLAVSCLLKALQPPLKRV